MPTPQEIAAFVQANQGNPQAILAAANANGVSLQDIANATGYSGQQIGSYLGNNGLSASDFTGGAAAAPVAPAASSNLGLTPAQINEARTWISGNGLGTFQNGALQSFGGFDGTSTTDPNTNSAYNIAGAAKAKGYNPDQLAQILGGGYTGAGIGSWLGEHQPQINAGEGLYRADSANLGLGGTGVPTGATSGAARPMAGGMPGAAGATSGGTTGYTGSNPYLAGAADDITRRVNLSRDQALQGIRGNAISMGGLGGSRQGVAEAQAISGSADNLAGQLTNMFGNDWTNQQNRDLTTRGQDMGFYTQQRGQDQSGAALGASLYGLGTQGGWTPLQNASDIYGRYTGLNNSTTSGTNTGGGAMGALGGALGVGQLSKNLGWW